MRAKYSQRRTGEGDIRKWQTKAKKAVIYITAFFALRILGQSKAENAWRFLSLWYNLNSKMVMRKKKYIYFFYCGRFLD